MSALADTSLLVRLMERDTPRGEAAEATVTRYTGSDEQLYVCAQVLIEFWVVATRPRDVNGLGLEVAEAAAALTDFMAMFSILPEPPDIAERWRGLVVAHEVRGKTAHDARLVALIEAVGINTVVTFNERDFRRYAKLVLIDPMAE